MLAGFSLQDLSDTRPVNSHTVEKFISVYHTYHTATQICVHQVKVVNRVVIVNKNRSWDFKNFSALNCGKLELLFVIILERK